MFYTIKSGKHYCRGFHFRIHTGREMHFKVRFDLSCHYVPRNSDDKDISKVTGYSGLWPGRNSIRLGFRCDDNTPAGQVELWAYWHVKGQHYESFICLGKCNEDIEVSLKEQKVDVGWQYVVSAQGVSRYLLKPWTFPIGITHFPYFGGDNTSPHDMGMAVW